LIPRVNEDDGVDEDAGGDSSLFLSISMAFLFFSVEEVVEADALG
jgi:hypothetical protein